jgi:hypothetical protein
MVYMCIIFTRNIYCEVPKEITTNFQYFIIKDKSFFNMLAYNNCCWFYLRMDI